MRLRKHSSTAYLPNTFARRALGCCPEGIFHGMTIKTHRVAMINREFARKIFGSENAALGSYYKLTGGTRLQVVGIVEDGKYASLAEESHAAMFVPMLQSPSSQTFLVVRSERGSELVPAIKS